MRSTAADRRDTEEARRRTLSFRLSSHHLDRRLPAGRLLDAAGACGVQNTPPGSANLSLLARVDGLEAGDVMGSLEKRKDLAQAWSLRTAPHVFPTRDLPVFTLGLLPREEGDLRHFVRGVGAYLDEAGMTAAQLLDAVSTAASAVLAGNGLAKDPLGKEVADGMRGGLAPGLANIWERPDMFGRFGETMVRFALYLCSLNGTLCHGPWAGNKHLLVRPDRWFDGDMPSANPEGAGAELVRRYLHCYGPSTPGHFSDWAGISPHQGASMWALVTGEVVRVGSPLGQAFVLRADSATLASPPTAEGARLLPPHDPLLQLRDRDTLLPDRSRHKLVWRPAGSPGVALVDGAVAGVWRPKKRGKVLDVVVEGFGDLDARTKRAIEEEAEAMASMRGARLGKLEVRRPA